jgi:AbrB family looped-hinge helix DNA binding protein
MFLGERIKVLQKGKITIPAEIRERLGIGEGDYIELRIENNKVVLLAPNTVSNPTDLLSGLAEGVEIIEPIKHGLRKASAFRIKKKIERAAP